MWERLVSDSRARFLDAELERALVELGRHFPFPPTPDVAHALESRLESSVRPSSLPIHRLPRLRNVVLGALTILLLVAGTTLAASPAARAAVAEWFGIPGIRITTGGAVLPPGSMGRKLELGRRVTLADAQALVTFHVLLPALPGLGHPDEVYLDTFPPGGRVSLLYRARPGRPQTQQTKVGVLLTEFQATADQVFFGKTTGWRSMPQGIRVGADRGYWIKADHLIFIYRTLKGRQVWSNVRLAGKTLLWEHGEITLRLESAVSERVALRIATSMH
jgi:hypothetical protein